MSQYHPPSGLHQGLELLINPNWSAEQALAVFELLNDLCDRIWVHYQLELIRELSEEQITSFDVPETDPPF